MNAFFHSSSIFRFATETLSNLDQAAAEFNQSIYGYLKDRYGTLKASPTSANAAGVQESTLLEAKYRNWSRSKIRRTLEKLKHRSPVIQGSPICHEIVFCR